MNNSFKGMFNGDFFKKKSILSDADISSLQTYNAEIQRGVRPNIAFHKTMRESSVAAQNMAKSAKGAAVNLNAIPKVSRAATLGIKALSVAMNIGLMVGITTLISGITKMVGASEEMSQQASEATSKYKEQTSSLEEYKGKITELKTALSSENLTYADARDKRNQLLEVQKQLIDTYGAEASGIDLVNGSLDDQIDKLETLNKQKRQEWENEVNKLSTGQQWQKWGGFIGISALQTFDPYSWYRVFAGQSTYADDWLNNFDNTTNIERIQKKIENFSKSIKFGSISDELKSQLDSFEGVSFDGLKMTISGDAKTVSETVTQIQTQVIGSREDLQWLNQDLKDIYNSAKKIVDENWDTYNTALQNQILDDKTGLEYYGKLTEAYETYQEAIKDGDEKTINEAKEGYAKILSDIAGSDMSDSFKKFFENMYPDISDIVDDWKFEVDIVPKINTNKDGLKDDIETVKTLTTEEISAAFENNGTGVSKDEWEAIANLNAEAQANGLDLTTFLEQLREAGYLVSQLDKDIEKVVNDTKNRFGKEGIRKQLEAFNKDDTIDFTIRPKVDTSELEKAGWGEQEPGTATVYSVTGYSEDYGLDAGKAVVVTPILPDGTVLSPEQVDEYIRKILTGEKVDVDIKMGVFDGENYKTEADEFANTIHELHQKYFLDNSYVDWNKYFEEQSINTQEEVDKWNEVTEGAKTAAEAMDMWANAKKNVNKTTVSLSEMEKASDKIGKLSSAFKELSDDGYITTKTLGEIKTATGLADDEWAEYENKLLNAKKGSADFNQVLSELTYKILENEFATIDLTNATDEEITAIENKIAATLRESGVENANAVAHEYVGIARVNAAIAAYDGTQASYDSAAALISESLSAEQAKVAMNQLELAKRNVNNAKITPSDDIDNIIAIANAALASAQTLKDLARAKAELAEGFVGPVSKSTMDMMNGSYDFEFDKLDPSDFKVSAPRYSGGSSSKGSGSGSSSKEDAANYKDATDAIINRINLRATELKQDEELINSKLDLIDTETEYAKAIKLTNSLISNQRLRKEELIKANNQISHEAQYLRDSNPYDEDSWFDSQGEATEAYYSLLNSVGTGTEQEKIETLFKQIQKYKKAYLENEKEIRDVDKDIFENTKKISDYARNALEKQFKERTEDSERWISTEESLDKLNTKEKLAAYKRIIAYHDDFLKQIETDENLSAKDRDELWKEYYDQREDYAIKAYETEREIVDNASSELERIISLETKNLQRKNEELDKSLTKEQKILEIMNSRYDILDKLAEAEHESDKAILESRRSKEYLSPAEYNLLFNEEDYLETKDKIKTLRNESEKLSLDVTAQINKAYAENNLYLAEAITSEYQRQLALKERELEILQREIDLEKKQQQLNNVLAEKNVKFLNKQGQWEWVADLDKVNQAEEDLADAKYVYDKAVEEKNKQLAINLQESVISNIETSMGENDKKIQELEDTIELITEKVDLLQNPIQDITGLVTELASKGIAGMNAALGDLVTMLSEVTGVQYDIPSYIPTSYQLLESTSDLKNVTSLYASEKPQTTFNGVTFDKNFDYQDLINKEKALDYPDSFKVMELMKKREAKLAWIKEYGLSGYALGTKKAQPGLSWVDESGQETYVTSHGVLHNFIGGEMVFNPEQTKNLWELSNIDYSKMFSPQIINMDSLSFKKPEVQNRSYFEGANINVYNPADFNDFMRQMNDTIKNKKV